MDGDSGSPSGFLRIPLHRLLHPERRIAGPYRVVLVGEGRAEEGHDPVAHHLVDGAFVPVDGLHHTLEDGIEELTGLLGVPVGQELHGALQIREQHRDLLALALEGTPGCEDLFGEVLWRIRLGGSKPARSRLVRQGCAAFAAELLCRRVGRPAGGARSGEAGATLPAELLTGGVLVLAPRALHAGASTRCAEPSPRAWKRQARRTKGPQRRSVVRSFGSSLDR